MSLGLSILIIASTVYFSYKAFQNPYLKGKYLFIPYYINKNKEWYRFFSHGIIHADWNHLIFNMITLFFFGPLVEHYYREIFGGLWFLNFVLLYVGALFFSSIVSFAKNKDNPGYAALGASGAVSAVLFASIMFDPMGKIFIFFIPIGIPGFVFAFLYLAYSAYMSKKQIDNIGHDAHFYGALYGVVLTIALKPQIVYHFLNQLGL